MNEDVSRETSPPGRSSVPATPDAARRLFPSGRVALAERFTELLATEGVVRGLIGPREAPRLWERHVLNSAVLCEVLPQSASVCDLGTGAGLPGIVVAIARPDLSLTLVEPLLRRTTFLEEVVAELDLTGVTVVRGRAEDLHGRHTYDVVTSRALAPLDRLLTWSMPLVALHGALIAMKGRSVADEIDAAGARLADYGCTEPVVSELGVGLLDPPTRIVRVAWANPARVGWPLVPPRGASRRGLRPR